MPRILFLVRGHGFGHAARDARVIAALRSLRPEAEIDVLASGSAAGYFALHGVEHVDMGVADEEDMTPEAARRVWEVMAGTPRPDLTVSDEVVWAMPYCERVWGRRGILLTDWFYAELGAPAQDAFLDHAGEIVVLDFAGAHPGPYATKAPIRRAGPVVGEFAVTREAARTALGVPDGRTVAVLTVGGMAGQADNRRIAVAALDAWLACGEAGQRLYVLGDRFADVPAARADDVVWVGVTNRAELYYAAADAVIVNAYGTVAFDLAWNGVPVVGMTDPAVPYPESFARRVGLLASAGLIEHVEPGAGRDALWAATRAALARPRRATGEVSGGLEWTSGAAVAAHLLRRLDDLDDLDDTVNPREAPIG
ncbi:hypothetical protein [Spongiactinospora sp. TRM90649]|uniref:hypothetical protein n=1 Tax=Spongiactinospora sp. TRM90649 TaxID=3031114 RepID=UPI0023F7B2BC|nr:hypothetical protein [Spongiactinospora sp. TRM90649]MDF5757587.1 hypothetical protein [Spongiactinospora sp. TRM90649]